MIAWLQASACRSPDAWRREADRRALEHIRRAQTDSRHAGKEFKIERPSDLLRRHLIETQGLPSLLFSPEEPGPVPKLRAEEVTLTLMDALRVGARNSREFQDAKESVFRAALALDLRQDEFRHSFTALLSGAYRDQRGEETAVRGAEGTALLNARQALSTGTAIAARLAVDVVKLLTLDRDSAYGIMADATITLPLWRGAGREVVLEPLRQAERNLLYALYEFEHFRRGFAVRIAGEYLTTLQQMQSAHHAAENEERIVMATRRAEKLARAGRLPEVQVDQARQDLLRARERTIAARLAAEQRLDRLKLTLGLPPDARVALDVKELDQLTTAEIAETDLDMAEVEVTTVQEIVERWILMALRERLDLRVAHAKEEDARRAARVAADALRSGLSLELSTEVGERRSLSSASSDNAQLDWSRARIGARLGWEWPWRRAAERNAWRESLMAVERAARAVEETEDQIKAQVRSLARDLVQAQQSVAIQRQALSVARRRIESVDVFLQAGRAQIRDLLDAQEALVSAQNALAAAVVNKRLTELSLLRDLEQLELDDEGVWREIPHEMEP